MGLITKQMPDEQEPPAEVAAEATDPNAEAAEAEDTSTPEQDASDPGLQQAMQFAMSALYENGAAKQIADTLKRSQDPAEALANTAYEIISITDEKTNGAVPDELLVLFASNVLEEVADIAAAAGIEISAADIASAMKTMILRYLGENGVDTTELQGAMDQVDPQQFNEAAIGEGK